MNRAPVLLRIGGGRLLGLILLVTFLSSCQGMTSYRGGKVSQENRIPLVENGKDSGSWNTRDIEVDYQYVKNGSKLELSGKVLFTSVITYNFIILDYFHLNAVFTDEQGNVLETTGLLSTAKSDPDDPEPFNVTLAVPGNAKFMAFSYSGVGRETGEERRRGSSSYFWHYPVH